MRRRAVERHVANRVAEVIAGYERNRANPEGAGGAGAGNTGGNKVPELAVMCPTMVTPEYKKIERYIWGLFEKFQGNVTSSKLTTIHEVVTMAPGLVDQAVWGKAIRISDSNKRKWEEQQKGNNNNNYNNTHHHQQNRRQEAVRAYAAPAEGRGYAGNLPLCN
ncbi:hypothetical protein Tco_0866856 [Tanacetum coccineum]